MNILSLFDGMSCGMIAAERAGIIVDNYYASEIDKYSQIVSNANYPKIHRLGDVTKWKEWDIDWSSIDLLIGGSPCQGFSFSGKQLAFDDTRSKLFFVYVDILNHIKSVNKNVKFLLENVKMKKEHLCVISEYLGVNPILINSNLVSAQNRLRYYWCNWNTTLPLDKNIFLCDVIGVNECNFKIYQKDNPLNPRPSNKKSSCLTGTAHAAGNHSQMDVIVINNNDIPLTSTGRIDIHKTPKVRRYSVSECEILQTVPVGYTKLVSNSQAYTMLINGWTVDVIAHIFSCIERSKTMTAIRQKVVLTEKDINDYASGKLSMQDIAKAHGCTKDTVSKRMKETKRADVIEQIQHNSKRGAAKLSEKQIQEIITRVKNGELARDLAIEYHMDAASIRYHLKAHGIKAKRAERRDWVEPKAEKRKITDDFKSIIPKTHFTQFHSMMTRAMQA